MSLILCDAFLAAIGVSFTLAFASISPDSATLAGACIAAIFALNDARQRDKDRFNLACVFLASVVFGMTVPGGIAYSAAPEWAATRTWHVWVILGIVAGMLGWGFVAIIFAARDYLKRNKDPIAKGGMDMLGAKIGIPPVEALTNTSADPTRPPTAP